MSTKIRIGLGITLHLGDNNYVKTNVEIESEALQEGADKHDIIKRESDRLYQLAEDELIEKIARLVQRLEQEKYLPST